MSPYPAQVTREGIIAKARELIEAEGIDALSLSKLATALGIKAPSLYKHVTSKADLLREINTVTSRELVAAMLAVPDRPSPKERLAEMAQTYRRFAQQFPITYALAYANLVPDQRPDPSELEQLVLPLQTLWSSICGSEHALAALRGTMALIHGFVILEINEQFQRGGDLSTHFQDVVVAYISGWEKASLTNTYP